MFVSRVDMLKSSEGTSLTLSGLTELPSCPVCLERLVCVCVDVFVLGVHVFV